MILHYLGLDHIGHVEGPFGTSIKPKLQEMDDIIDQIAQRIQYWVGMDKNRFNSLQCSLKRLCYLFFLFYTV
jgi:predicted AlkP superfamily pyrophosphatase or phosphodiesterase